MPGVFRLENGKTSVNMQFSTFFTPSKIHLNKNEKFGNYVFSKFSQQQKL